MKGYTADDLTSSLQELTAQIAARGDARPEQFPAHLPTTTLSMPDDIENFLRETQEYSARVRTVNIGTY